MADVIRIVNLATDPDAKSKAEAEAPALSERLGIPIGRVPDDESALFLAFTDRGLELRTTDEPDVRGVCIDFREIDTRTGSGNLSRSQPLPRSIGARNTTVIDATAGLGHDAALLALMGYEVTAIERCPVVLELLRNGLARAKAHPVLGPLLGDRLRLIEGDAIELLRTIEPRPEVVYVDPMYPPRKKAALPKKAIRLLRDVVGHDLDQPALLEAARTCATNRVVVKRQKHAPSIAEDMSRTSRSKLVRYDVYLRGAESG